MQQKKSIGFGLRGWLLMFWAATGMLAYLVIGNYPLNILSDLYGGAQTLSSIYTGASLVGIAVQIIISSRAGKIKSWKNLGLIFGILVVLSLIGIMLIQPGTIWLIVYGLGTVISLLYGTWILCVLIGVWFPRRKGTVMGIVTFAYPIGNGVIGFFASGYFAKYGMLMGTQAEGKIGELIAAGTDPAAAEGIVSGQFAQASSMTSFIPFLIVILVGLIVGIIFIKDFPELCGCYRDNDKSMTPEVANAMMKAEEENRKTSVWTIGHTLSSWDYWAITIPCGLLLMFSVGAMTQTNAIISPYAEDLAWIGGYTGVMMAIAVFGIIGSYVFGVVDTKFGTRKSVMISMVCMIISGILGTINNATALLISLLLLAMFMGASSNFTVSAAVQYWRIEDFPNVFSVVNAVANILNAIGPVVIASLIATTLGKVAVFGVCGGAGIVGLILLFLFKPSRVKARDDKFRAAAGKPLDDVLVGRK